MASVNPRRMVRKRISCCNRGQSLKNQANGRGVRHKHDDEVKQGKIARPESAAPTMVSRHLASVEPGDSFDALLGEKRIAGPRNLRQSSGLPVVPYEATRHHPSSQQHRARRQLGWGSGTEPWQDYSSSSEAMSNRPDKSLAGNVHAEIFYLRRRISGRKTSVTSTCCTPRRCSERLAHSSPSTAESAAARW